MKLDFKQFGKIFKRYDPIGEEIDWATSQMRKSCDIKECRKWEKYIRELKQLKKDEKFKLDPKWVETVGTLVLKAAEIGLTVGLTVYTCDQMTSLAMKSYGLDEQMALSNGRVWNLATNGIEKLIPKKV